jgi:hypothetical protein
MIVDRNTMSGFSTRTLKNLAFIYGARGEGADVHIVTQLIVSLLGLIVFPYEFLVQNGNQSLQTPYSELMEKGWPAWNLELGEMTTLDKLIWHVRNSCSHNRIRFSSDSRLLSEVDIIFTDRPTKSAPDNWHAEINGEDFANFIVHFSQFLGADSSPSAR